MLCSLRSLSGRQRTYPTEPTRTRSVSVFKINWNWMSVWVSDPEQIVQTRTAYTPACNLPSIQWYSSWNQEWIKIAICFLLKMRFHMNKFTENYIQTYGAIHQSEIEPPAEAEIYKIWFRTQITNLLQKRLALVIRKLFHFANFPNL